MKIISNIVIYLKFKYKKQLKIFREETPKNNEYL